VPLGVSGCEGMTLKPPLYFMGGGCINTVNRNLGIAAEPELKRWCRAEDDSERLFDGGEISNFLLDTISKMRNLLLSAPVLPFTSLAKFTVETLHRLINFFGCRFWNHEVSLTITSNMVTKHLTDVYFSSLYDTRRYV
jgi:hypothetical protein